MGDGEKWSSPDLRRLVSWVGVGLLIPAVIISLILMAGSRRAARVVEYRATLSRLTDEVVRLNNPLAEMFAQGVTPDPELVEVTREDLANIRAELEALGPPPDELAGANAALTGSIKHFEQAYDHLAANLVAGSAAPFDADFLTLATHGGEETHHTARALHLATADDLCTGINRLLPRCWLWP